jgi:hypothetical protein
MIGMPLFFDLTTRMSDFSLDLLRRIGCWALLHFCHEFHQLLPTSLAALPLVISQSAQMLILIEWDNNDPGLACLLQYERLVQIGNCGAVDSSRF